MRSSTIITVRVDETALIMTLDVSADVGAAGCGHYIISITVSPADYILWLMQAIFTQEGHKTFYAWPILWRNPNK